MPTHDEIQARLEAGIAAAKSGDRARARAFLEAVVSEDEGHELAWIWLASVVSTARERRLALQKVLQINPDNERAREALQRLSEVQSTAVDSERVARSVANQRGRRAPASDESGRSRWVNVALGALVIVGVLGALVILGTLLDPVTVTTPTPVPPPTRDLFAGVPTATRTTAPTSTPAIIIVTPRNRPTLPPTFTPTASPTATATPPPTATPVPLSDFDALLSNRGPDEALPSLYRMRGDATELERLATEVIDPVYDFTGRRVVFARPVSYEADENTGQAASTVTELFIAPVDNLDAAEQITEVRVADVHSPTWAPNGEQLVFVSDFDGDDELFLYDIEARTSFQLTFNFGVDRDPHWSPDGTRLVFASDRQSPNLTDIYTLAFVLDPDAATEEERAAANIITRLTDDSGNSFQPRWSPTGARITYVNDGDGDSDIYLMDADGERRVLLTTDSGPEDRHPNFTPDGRFVVFTSNRENEQFQTYRVNRRGRELTRMTRNDGEDIFVDYKGEVIFRVLGEVED